MQKNIVNWGDIEGLRKRNGGFTLVEMLVVLFIMATLAAMMTPSFAGYAGKVQAGVCESTALQIRRFYQACAVSGVHSLTEAQAQECLETAVETAGLLPDGVGAYTCPNGGRCAVEYGDGRVLISGIVCSVHGSVLGGAVAYAPEEIGESFGSAIKELGSALPYRDLYSLASDPETVALVLAKLPEGVRDSLTGKVWTLKYISYWSSYKLIVFNGSADELPDVDKKVPVTVYDPNTEPHVSEVTRHVGTRTVNGTGTKIKIINPDF